jgi:site-specific DNA-methyltransferase (adenine-specific)
MAEIKYAVGDCRQLIKELHDSSVQLVFTSPPYWNMRDYGVGKKQIGYYDTFEEYISKLNEVWMECFRVIKNNGVLAINVDDLRQSNELMLLPLRMADECKRLGFILFDVIIWVKTNPRPINSKVQLTHAYEYILILAKNSSYYREFKSYDLDIIKTSVSSEKNGDVVPFHEDLAKSIIERYTKEGDTVLDPFVGTGTVLKVCQKLNRNAIGFEINPDFEGIIKEKCKPRSMLKRRNRRRKQQ